MRILKTVLVMGLLCLTTPHLAAAALASPYAYDPLTPVALHGQAEPAVAQYDAVPYRAYKEAPAKRQGGRIIPPSTALEIALGTSPGSQGLGVSLLRGPRLIYAVKLKTGNQIHRVLVDAETAQVVGQ
ncbi:MAG: PepSY domain-containing protein [Parvibaculaceae bacterium]